MAFYMAYLKFRLNGHVNYLGDYCLSKKQLALHLQSPHSYSVTLGFETKWKVFWHVEQMKQLKLYAKLSTSELFHEKSICILNISFSIPFLFLPAEVKSLTYLQASNHKWGEKRWNEGF